MFGQWKRRFPVLATPIRFMPKKACNLIVAAAVLHNFAKLQGEEPFEINNVHDDFDEHP